MRNKVFLLVWLGVLAMAACQVKGPANAPTAAPVQPEAAAWAASLDHADDDHDADRRLAALRLGVHRQRQAVDVVIRHLHGDVDPKVREACAFAAGRIGGEDAVNALVGALASPFRAVRVAAARALADHLNQAVFEALAQVVEEDDEQVALAATYVLEAGGHDVGPLWAKRAGGTPPLVIEPTNVIHVDAERGSDEDSGAADQPVSSIAKGLTLLKPGGRLLVAGPAEGFVREAVVVPARLAGTPARPTEIVAWPDKPAPIIAPTRTFKSELFATDDQGRFRAKVDFRVYGAFLWRIGEQYDILPAVENEAELKPNTCWYDAAAGEVVIVTDGLPLSWHVELAFAEDGLRVDGASDVIVRGLGVQFAPDTGFDANVAPRVSFVDCTAKYCDRHGFFHYYAPSGLVRGCTARHCSYQGISVRSSPRTVVVGSTATDNGVDGILLLNDSDDCLVVDSVARGNFRGLSFIAGSDYGRVVGGDFAGNRSAAITFERGCLGGQVVPTP